MRQQHTFGLIITGVLLGGLLIWFSDQVPDQMTRASTSAVSPAANQHTAAFLFMLVAIDDEAMTLIDAAYSDGAVIALTMTPTWHGMSYSDRLLATNGMSLIWAHIASPNDPRRARIYLEYGDGRCIGGSSPDGVWVEE
jgi:hypothetical protein